MKAEQIARELEKIEHSDGRLTPEAVVEKARNPKHPLHNQFTWDDKKASHRWRLREARVLIVRYRPLVEVGEHKVKVVEYIRDPSIPSNEQGYRRISQIDEDDKYQAMQTELLRAEGALKRAYAVGIAIGYADELEQILTALVQTITRPRPSARPSDSDGDEDRPSA